MDENCNTYCRRVFQISNCRSINCYVVAPIDHEINTLEALILQLNQDIRERTSLSGLSDVITPLLYCVDSVTNAFLSFNPIRLYFTLLNYVVSR